MRIFIMESQVPPRRGHVSRTRHRPHLLLNREKHILCFFFIINKDICVSLCVSQLILQVLKLTTM
jgi:hypothetical protein